VTRPSVARWFDSQIRIWRPTPSKDEVGAEKFVYANVSTVGAAINRSNTSVTRQDGGMTPVGRLRWYGLPTLDVQPRDVCEVISGPDAGKSWEVDGPPTHPRGHHTQVDCVEWHGVLPTENVS
jgi:hypothetical protein